MADEPRPSDALVVDLLPPRTGPLALAMPALGLGLVLAGMGWAILNSPAGFPTRSILFLGIIALSLGMTLADRIAARQVIPRVTFHRDQVVLPKLGSRSSVTLRYDEISALYMVGRGEVERLFIDGRGLLLVFPRIAFGSVEAFSTVSGELWRRIQALPDGTSRITEFTKKSAVLASTMARPVFATKVLLFSIVAMYLLEFGSGAVTRTPAGTPPIGLISLGANARVLLEEGQIYRLVTSTFLHDPMLGSHLHVIMNGIALYSLGSLLEQLFGASGVVLMFFAGGVLGAFASAWAMDGAMSVGASTAVLGLFGGLAVLALRYRTKLPLVVRQTRRWWTVIIALNVALPMMFPFIDKTGHAGGFVGGAVVALLLTLRRPDALALFEAPSVLVRTAAGVVAVVCAAMGSIGVVRAWLDAEQDELKVLTRMVESHDASVETLNGVAYGIGGDRAPTVDSLMLAKDAAERAYAKSKADPNVGDTLATVLYRLGELDRAVALERESLAAGGDNETFFAAQLARFFVARMARSGALELAGTRTPTVTLASGKLVLELETGIPEDVVLFAIARERGELAGLVRARLGRSEFKRVELVLTKTGEPPLPDAVELEVVALTNEGPELGQAVGAIGYGYHLDVKALPSGIVRKADPTTKPQVKREAPEQTGTTPKTSVH